MLPTEPPDGYGLSIWRDGDRLTTSSRLPTTSTSEVVEFLNDHSATAARVWAEYHTGSRGQHHALPVRHLRRRVGPRGDPRRRPRGDLRGRAPRRARCRRLPRHRGRQRSDRHRLPSRGRVRHRVDPVHGGRVGGDGRRARRRPDAPDGGWTAGRRHHAVRVPQRAVEAARAGVHRRDRDRRRLWIGADRPPARPARCAGNGWAANCRLPKRATRRTPGQRSRSTTTPIACGARAGSSPSARSWRSTSASSPSPATSAGRVSSSPPRRSWRGCC